jgi:hypothetical protein
MSEHRFICLVFICTFGFVWAVSHFHLQVLTTLRTQRLLATSDESIKNERETFGLFLKIYLEY